MIVRLSNIPRLNIVNHQKHIFVTYIRYYTTRAMATNLPKLADVERLSPSIVRIMGGNSNKFTLQGTNTFVLGTNIQSLILLDTAQGYPEWKTNLSKHLKSYSERPTIATCILTHWHGDHTMGMSDLQDIFPEVKTFKAIPSLDPDNQLEGYTIHDIEEGDTFTDNDGFSVQALHCPGHTEDHMAFVITASKHSEEIGRIFTGDNVLGHGTAVFEDYATYLSSLEKMKARIISETKARSSSSTQAESNKIIAYPSHGATIPDAQAKIDEYLAHRRMREEEALNVLRFGARKRPELGEENVSGKDWTSMQMVKVIYADVGVHLHEPAKKGLEMILEKMKGEGRVRKTDNGTWVVGDRAGL